MFNSSRPAGPVRDLAVLLAITAGALGCFLFAAGAMPLTDPDEGRYAQIAGEMTRSGDWVVPTLFGLPYLEKPPLLFWLTAASFECLGRGELQARLVPAIAGALGVLASGWFAGRRFGPRAGRLAAVVLATSILYFVLARTVLADMIFAAGIAGAAVAFFETRDGSRAAGVCFWLALAVSVLAKGPAGIVIVGTIVAVDAVFSRSFAVLFAPRLWLGVPIFLALAGPWFWLVQQRHPDFLYFYLYKEHLARAGGAEHSEPFFFFVPVLLVGLFPWTPLAIPALPGWLRELRDRSREAAAVRFCVVWAAAVFVLFSLAGGKLATYILPMFPPVAILLGRSLDRLLAAEAGGRGVEHALRATGILFLVLAAALAGVVLYFAIAISLLQWTLVAVPLLAGGISTLVWRREPFVRPLTAIFAAIFALYLALAAVAPRVTDVFTAYPLITRLGSELAPEDTYAFAGAYFPSAAFYLDRPPLLVGVRPELRFGHELSGGSPRLLPSLGALHEATRDGRLFCLSDERKKREKELSEALGPLELLGRTVVASLWLRPRVGDPAPDPGKQRVGGEGQ